VARPAAFLRKGRLPASRLRAPIPSAPGCCGSSLSRAMRSLACGLPQVPDPRDAVAVVEGVCRATAKQPRRPVVAVVPGESPSSELRGGRQTETQVSSAPRRDRLGGGAGRCGPRASKAPRSAARLRFRPARGGAGGRPPASTRTRRISCECWWRRAESPSSGWVLKFHRVGHAAAQLPNGRTVHLWSRGDDWVSNQVFWRRWAGYEPETSPIFFRAAQRAAATIDVGA
jgi:hypothetical protein